MNNKQIAVSFLCLASSGKVREAYEKYIHPEFRHHNPHFRGDRESPLFGMEQSAVEFPDKSFEAVRALEDGNLVVVHGKIRFGPDRHENSLIHIFRFEGERIVEE
jgi:predicted SnoaL-like aldol condensation-catalyzing enzyme